MFFQLTPYRVRKLFFSVLMVVLSATLLSAKVNKSADEIKFVKEYTRGYDMKKILNICKEWLKTEPKNPVPNYFIWGDIITKGKSYKSQNLKSLTFGAPPNWNNAKKLISFFMKLRDSRGSAKDTRYENTIAHIYNVTGDYKKAIEFYNIALEHASRNAVTHINIAGCYRKLEKYDDALYHYKRALNITKGSPALYIQLAGVSICKGNYKNAEYLYEESIKRWPDYKDTYTALLELYNMEKKYGESVRLARNIINTKVMEDNYIPYYYIADAYFKKANYKLALKYFNLAQEQKFKMDDHYYHEYLGRCYLGKNDIAQAEKSLLKSVASRPTASGYFYLGKVYEKKGNFSKARKCYENILSGNYSAEWKKYIGKIFADLP